MKKTKRWIAMFAMLALGLGVFLSGCSDDDDEVVTPPPPSVSGLEFTTENMVDVAYIGTDTADIFSKIGFVFSEIIGNLPAPPDNVAQTAYPLAAVPVGESGLCQVAEVDNVVWNDNDNNSLPTAGDTIEVFWEDCEVEPGTNLYGDPSGSGNPAVTFTFTDNVSVVPPFVVKGTLDLNILIVESGFSSTLKGTMPATGSTTDNQAVTIDLGDVSGTAADTEITIVDLDEETGEINFGCFDVRIIFDNVANPFDFSMSVRGVEKIQTPLGANIMQLGDYEEGLAPGSMSFVNGIPDSGSLKLLSFDNRAGSTVIPDLASCYEDVTGTTSELVTAEVGGLGQVDLFTDIDPADPWGGTPAATQDIDWLDGMI